MTEEEILLSYLWKQLNDNPQDWKIWSQISSNGKKKIVKCIPSGEPKENIQIMQTVFQSFQEKQQDFFLSAYQVRFHHEQRLHPHTLAIHLTLAQHPQLRRRRRMRCRRTTCPARRHPERGARSLLRRPCVG